MGLVFPLAPPPKQLAKFLAINGSSYSAPSTEGDILLHVSSDKKDICYEITRLLIGFLDSFTYSVDETHGFSYLDNRSIIGFVDGSGNPVNETLLESTIIGEEDSEFKGGSYMFTQKYLHDMKGWNSISTEEQERIIGRKKDNDTVLFPEKKYKNSHTDIASTEDEKGNKLKILRANVVFSTPSKNEYGTYFISYSRTFDVVDKMLKNMFLGNEKGPHDKLLEYSKAISGSLYFAPGNEIIKRFYLGEIK